MIRLITGCSRAGSKFTHKLLNQLGLDIGHEGMGKDGTCSHYANGLKIKYPDLYSKYNFGVVLHQVRNPIKNIESLTTMQYWDYSNRGNHLPLGPSVEFVAPLEAMPFLKSENLILQCARYWYHYNKSAEIMSEWTYPVEKLVKDEDVFSEFCFRVGIESVPSEIQMPEENNSRKNWPNRKKVSWEDLELIDNNLTDKIKNISEKWGYNE